MFQQYYVWGLLLYLFLRMLIHLLQLAFLLYRSASCEHVRPFLVSFFLPISHERMRAALFAFSAIRIVACLFFMISLLCVVLTKLLAMISCGHVFIESLKYFPILLTSSVEIVKLVPIVDVHL